MVLCQSGVVSVVTPVFNGEAYLRGYLNALLVQTYPRMELILSDDGSQTGPSGWRRASGTPSPPGATGSAWSPAPTGAPPPPSTGDCLT